MNLGLHYNNYLAVIEGFSDANWISESNEMKTISSYVFILGGAVVSWKSTKQTLLSQFMEKELIALDLAGAEAEWIRNLLADIPLGEKPIPLVFMHCDNQSTIALVKSALYNGKRRHICLRHNSIRHLITHGVVSLDFVRSSKNLADTFTKG